MNDNLVVIKKSELIKWLYENPFVEPYELLKNDKHKEIPTINLKEVAERLRLEISDYVKQPELMVKQRKAYNKGINDFLKEIEK